MHAQNIFKIIPIQYLSLHQHKVQVKQNNASLDYAYKIFNGFLGFHDSHACLQLNSYGT